jgi:hypothetical protein
MGLAFLFEADHSHLNFQGELRHGLCRTHVICEILCNCAEIDICFKSIILHSTTKCQIPILRSRIPDPNVDISNYEIYIAERLPLHTTKPRTVRAETNFACFSRPSLHSKHQILCEAAYRPMVEADHPSLDLSSASSERFLLR